MTALQNTLKLLCYKDIKTELQHALPASDTFMAQNKITKLSHIGLFI